MAITKFVSPIHPAQKGDRYGGLRRLLNYITNPNKTKAGSLVGYNHVNLFHPAEDMIQTMEGFGKVSDNPHCRLAYHFTIAFKKGDGTTQAQAYKVLEEFCRTYLQGYELVFSVHDDKEHMHGHIAFNATSFATGMKYRYEDGDWAKIIQPEVDRICRKYGCHTLSEDTGISIEEYEEDRLKRKRKAPSNNRHGHCSYYNEATRKKLSRTEIIRNDIDEVILLSKSFEEFLHLMRQRGYTIKQGNVKHMTVRQHDGTRNFRVDKLDKDGYYSEKMIQKRIADKNKPLPSMPVNEEYRFIVPKTYRVLRLPRRKLNKYEKQYYAKMYRLGMKKKNYWVTYSEIKQSMIRIENLNSKLRLIADSNGDLNTLLANREQQKDICERFQMELEEISQKQKTFHLIFRAAAAMQKLEPYHTAWERGDVSCSCQNKEYLKWDTYLKEYGYTIQEAILAKKNLTATRKNAKIKIRQNEQRLNMFDEIISELQKNLPEDIQVQEICEEIQEQERKEQHRTEIEQKNNVRTKKGGRT